MMTAEVCLLQRISRTEKNSNVEVLREALMNRLLSCLMS